jgi:hypothetical protein
LLFFFSPRYYPGHGLTRLFRDNDIRVMVVRCFRQVDDNQSGAAPFRQEGHLRRGIYYQRRTGRQE